MPIRTSALFSWLNEWSREEREGRLEAIYRAPVKGAPMESLQEARVLESGLEGDRYALGTGYWIKTDACAVTLSPLEELQHGSAKSKGGPQGGSFEQGEHRRNLVVSGIPYAAYRGRDLRIGEVLFRFHRLRPPCAYLERLLWKGSMKALGKGSGVGLYVVEPGRIRVGDKVELIDP